jgi:ribosomal protein L24
MISAVRVKTKFKFGDHVVVKYGFHRGMAGRVTSYMPRTISTGWKTKELIEYHIVTDTKALDILVDEDQIEIVGAK